MWVTGNEKKKINPGLPGIKKNWEKSAPRPAVAMFRPDFGNYQPLKLTRPVIIINKNVSR